MAFLRYVHVVFLHSSRALDHLPEQPAPRAGDDSERKVIFTGSGRYAGGLWEGSMVGVEEPLGWPLWGKGAPGGYKVTKMEGYTEGCPLWDCGL